MGIDIIKGSDWLKELRKHMRDVQTKYMIFRPEGETWQVLNRGDGTLLGDIRWYSQWRQCCFFPEPDTVFSGDCLVIILGFLANLKKEKQK